MQTKRLATLLAALVLPAIARGGEAAAPGRDEPTYIVFKLGAAIPVGPGLEGFATGTAVEGVGGYQFKERLAVELALGRQAMRANGPLDVEGVPGPLSSADVSAFPLTATLVATLPVGPLRLQGLLGCGIVFTTARAITISGASAAKVSSSPLAVRLGARGDAALAADVRVGLEVGYQAERADLWATAKVRRVDAVIAVATLAYAL